MNVWYRSSTGEPNQCLTIKYYLQRSFVHFFCTCVKLTKFKVLMEKKYKEFFATRRYMVFSNNIYLL